MKIALDPYMFRALSIDAMVRTVAELGYEYIELSPRDDFMPFFVHPRADDERIAELKNSLRTHGVQLSSVLPLYKWSSPDESERQAAVRYWKRMIEITAELECPLMNSEFNGRPERAAESEAAFWRSLEELLPLFEREGIALNLEAHPDDFCEENTPAVDLVRAINKPWVNYLYCAPHTFHLSGAAEVGADIAQMLRYAGDKLQHVHIADSFNHKGSSGLRYITNPPGTPTRIHQHLDIDQGEVDWPTFFTTLRNLNFDGVATACVFAWEERARESSALMLDRIRKELTA
ncbi:sugar phosphate isomerase/epimerase family protein [Streptomyces acidiscabies]|uniref:Sugar phosphate isomerase/epimerase n=1 Tax=Streptomyces acidiscabies TaxID=42234 RepID=A0AAP6B530_9ACTN|nr:sugar phosphate isomerase/epimerase [Streptomyces acidiscabies]MBP5941365.1 sugar phosphate isomerase/epimerase [Streptomyces sp. LBUM 1476]MBZ3912726.1 sugar phosphate isomerase/epimerase [Streptomyces acidiscabies]MDX2958210.1 sugar phosphate isomerase/epimerase [Streptomyces acidiscabies]MDX3018577.1 sugar phosphate isomerase/epimerase [Streptomyces acidiscabies]MDX3791120.1 sugar phosphate isomerase/epimerase [Streptomyces acidiscabies]